MAYVLDSYRKSPDEVLEEEQLRVERAKRRGLSELSVGAGRRSLQTLPDLQGLTSLRRLKIHRAQIKDIRPLTHLKNLQSLELIDTSVEDISPLSELPNLRTIDLSSSRITSLRALAGLRNLVLLRLDGTRILKLDALEDLSGLTSLSIGYTNISDISVVENFSQLKSFSAPYTGIESLTPLARCLELESVNIAKTRVSDLGVLAGATKLKSLQFSYTSVSNLDPVANCTSLKVIDASNTAVSDLAPLSKLSALTHLNISRTKVADLTPLAALTALCTNSWNWPPNGLEYAGCPIVDPVVLGFLEQKQPGRTLSVLNHIRRQIGLSEVVPGVSNSSETQRHLASIVEQLEKGESRLHTREQDGKLMLAFEDGDHDPLAKQIHPILITKANALLERGKRFQNSHPELAATAREYSDSVSVEFESLHDRIGLLWSLSVSLGSHLVEAIAAKSSGDSLRHPLEGDDLRALTEVVNLSGTWLRLFPDARRLDEEFAKFHATNSHLSDAKEILRIAIDESDLIEENSKRALEVATSAPVSASVQSKKSEGFLISGAKAISVGGLVIGLTAAGYLNEIGSNVADRSIIAQKVGELVLQGEDKLVRLFSTAPADVRAAVSEAVSRIKAKEIQLRRVLEAED